MKIEIYQEGVKTVEYSGNCHRSVVVCVPDGLEMTESNIAVLVEEYLGDEEWVEDDVDEDNEDIEETEAACYAEGHECYTDSDPVAYLNMDLQEIDEDEFIEINKTLATEEDE